jgi:hypothetical protein
VAAIVATQSRGATCGSQARNRKSTDESGLGSAGCRECCAGRLRRATTRKGREGRCRSTGAARRCRTAGTARYRRAARARRCRACDKVCRNQLPASGLEIVRKTLSEHEIAVIQTTAIDQASRMLNLTTLLAHSSGEWIASYWPVCSVAEVANPHRMGAALTYARRYALFTLVGIAGEDDLDAPDICMPGPATGSSTVGLQYPSQPQGNGKVRGAVKTPSLMVLPVDESASLRDRLLSEVAGLASQEGATSWAREALASKNSLTASDAKMLEDAFEQKLAGSFLAEAATPGAGSDAPSVSAPGSQEAGLIKGTDPHQPTGIDKSVLAISVPRRYRNKEHLRFVTHQPCLLCGRRPSDAHHLRFVQPRALGRKASDEFAVPLCRTHHRAVHRAGDEWAWWKATGIDPLKAARKLLERHAREQASRSSRRSRA